MASTCYTAPTSPLRMRVLETECPTARQMPPQKRRPPPLPQDSSPAKVHATQVPKLQTVMQFLPLPEVHLPTSLFPGLSAWSLSCKASAQDRLAPGASLWEKFLSHTQALDQLRTSSRNLSPPSLLPPTVASVNLPGITNTGKSFLQHLSQHPSL